MSTNCTGKTPRHRKRSEPTATETLIKYYQGNVFDSRVCTMSSKDETINDYVVPCFRKRIASGEIINNSCTHETNSVRTSGGGSYYAVRYNGEVYSTSGGNLSQYQFYLGGVDFLSGLSFNTSDLILDSKLQALSHVDETPYAFGEDVGEIKETMQFLRHPFQSLLKLGKHFDRNLAQALAKKNRRRRYNKMRQFSRYAKEVSDAWTEVRFAASPLVRSTLDAFEAASWYNGATPPKRLIARGHNEDVLSQSDTFTHYFSGTIYDVWKRTWDGEIDVSAGILYEVSNPVHDLRWRLGLRVQDVPETVWQLMPYSFMVDRVWDVSKMIRSLTTLADPRVKILAGWVRQRYNGERSVSLVSETNPGWTVTISPDVWTQAESLYDRQPWVPSASDTIPRVKPLGLVKDITSTLDLAALTYQYFTRKVK